MEDIEDFWISVGSLAARHRRSMSPASQVRIWVTITGVCIRELREARKMGMKLCAGDWVEVRSKDEILATLDMNGRLEGLPFMPQMLKWCGQRFQVHKRAHKTCDTVTGAYCGRQLPSGIHLDLRCDGQAYGGCQAACLIFWKEAWLKPVKQGAPASTESNPAQADVSSGCTEADVLKGTQAPDQSPGGKIRYICQATELLNYTLPLKWWDARQYVEDFTSGNTSLPRMFRAFLYFAFTYGTMAKRGKLGRPARWLYDRIQSLWDGIPFPRRIGELASGKETPVINLNLQPGDLVRVRPYAEILSTIDTANQNKGMPFDAEMVPFCGKLFRVRTRVETFIDEKTGYIRQMKTPGIILEGVYCQSRYSESRVFCPRSIYTWWREIWLERANADSG
jgi:hypothetical protein